MLFGSKDEQLIREQKEGFTRDLKRVFLFLKHEKNIKKYLVKNLEKLMEGNVLNFLSGGYPSYDGYVLFHPVNYPGAYWNVSKEEKQRLLDKYGFKVGFNAVSNMDRDRKVKYRIVCFIKDKREQKEFFETLLRSMRARRYECTFKTWDLETFVINLPDARSVEALIESNGIKCIDVGDVIFFYAKKPNNLYIFRYPNPERYFEAIKKGFGYSKKPKEMGSGVSASEVISTMINYCLSKFFRLMFEKINKTEKPQSREELVESLFKQVNDNQVVKKTVNLIFTNFYP